MKKEPLVSVIIPNYNHASFLHDRIESVLNQTFKDFEIILLDDRSTDNSLDILHQYKNHPKVKHFEVNNKNSGSVFKQWVKGTNLAKGKYTWIAESDDVAHPEFLEKMVNFAEQKDNLGLVFCKSRVIDENSLKLSKVLQPPQNESHFEINGEEEVSKYIIKKLSIQNASSVVFKSIALRSLHQNKLSQFTNVGDMFSYIFIGLHYKNCFLDDFLNYHRIHGENTTVVNSINNKILIDRINLIQYLIPYFNAVNSKRDLLHFYFRQILKSLDHQMYMINKKTLNKFYKFRYFNFRTYYSIRLLLLIYQIGKGKIPFSLRKLYKNFFENITYVNQS